MMIPDFSNRRKGHYLGTEIGEKWWRRYRKNKFFARGNGEYWLDDTSLYFRRYLTRHPIEIPFAKVIEVKIGKSHAGRWLLRSPVLKLIWQTDGLRLSSGFIVSRSGEATEAVSESIRDRICRMA
jgi:hypothetical protein